jgi:hypothetical protein
MRMFLVDVSRQSGFTAGEAVVTSCTEKLKIRKIFSSSSKIKIKIK